MKIAQVDVNYNFSSTGKIVADLVAGLSDLGHLSMAFFGRGPDSGQGNVHRISTTPEVLFHALGTRISGLTDGFSPIATRRLIRQLDDFMPDIVHLHDLHGYYVDIGPLVNYLKSRRISTVWTFHAEFMYTGKCGYAFDCEKWKSECGQCPDLKGYPQSWFVDQTTRMFREKKAMFSEFEQLHLVAPSEWLAHRIRQSMVGGKQLSVIHNGLNLSIFYQRDASELKKSLGLSNEYIVLSVGSDLMSERKGGRWVLELAKRRPDAKIMFLMVGVDQIPRDLPDNVRMLSRVFDQNLLAEYYSMADVLLLTSTKETFSMVSAESLACGTPIIGFDSGAPTEVALPGYGEFVPYADIQALEALLWEVKEGDIRLKDPDACLQFAKERYSREAMVNGYEQVYRKLTDMYSGRQ